MSTILHFLGNVFTFIWGMALALGAVCICMYLLEAIFEKLRDFYFSWKKRKEIMDKLLFKAYEEMK